MHNILRSVAVAAGIAAFVALPSISFAQGASQLFDVDKMTSRSNSVTSQLLTSDQVPTDDVVDPETYQLGPGDVVSFQTTGLDFAEKFAVVSPEGSLVLDRYGMFNVYGKSLQQVRAAISDSVHKRTPDVDLFLTLRRPRLIYVTLRGNVPSPGTYAVPASMKVSTLVIVSRQPGLLSKNETTANKNGMSAEVASPSNSVRAGAPMLSGYAIRNISVRHKDGVELVDIPRSLTSGQGKFDPHLREGDIVNVPYDIESYPTISISGSVVTPSTLAYKKGDRASILLAAAGGLNGDADKDNIVLVQSGGEGKVKLSVDDNFKIVGNDPELQPGSSIIVEREVRTGALPKQGVVEVYGEVNTPGAVIIEPGITKLTQVLQKAGGVIEGASLTLSYVVRPEHSTFTERESLIQSRRTFMYSDLTLEDTIRYNLDQSYRTPYVSCNFQKAVADTNSYDNVLLQSGDIIVVAKTPDRVYVYGQVMQPGHVTYTPGRKLEDYVKLAGGFAAGAKEGRARIIRGKSKVWVDDTDALVEPGDEVYVPRAPDIPPGIELQTWAILAGVLSSIVAITATIITIANN